MGFNKVYNSLLEVFPQIDARALRAVAIEHSKDADAAVQAVLEEIIPFFVERSRPSSPLARRVSEDKSSEAPLSAISSTQTADGPTVDTVDSAEVQNGCSVNSEKSVNDADNDYFEPLYAKYDSVRIRDLKRKTAGLTLSEESHESRININVDVSSCEPVALIDNSGVNTVQVEISGNPETEETFAADRSPESSMNTISDVIPCHTLGTEQDMNNDINQKMDFVQEREGLVANLQTESCTAANEKEDLEKSNSDGNNSVDGTASLTVRDLTMSSLDSSVQLVDVPDMDECNLENLDVSLSDDTVLNMEAARNVDSPGNGTTLSTSMSKSSQIQIMDVLEETIADARNNKKTLFSAMESVISLMWEVELKEKAAEKAKEEALIGGNHILDKVEELKQMLQHAKGANDMHAGEVYGEKAILATELRELQSRVFSLSDERDKSLSVLDQMRQTLEVRLAAADNVIKSIELEKLENEMAARKLLADQELIMEQVVKESNILKQQAEDNAKLQEFLLERGRLVDMLQGEIAVICQDVRVLKEKFDEHVPFSQSLSSSQTSRILASSSSSLKSLIPDQVERVPELDDSFETQKTGDPITCFDERVAEDEATGDDSKAVAEDGWDLLDSCEFDG